MNAEGVERDIIAALQEMGTEQHRIRALFGSIGDIRKCFGEEDEKIAFERLKAMGLPYVYFTSGPKSWLPALEQFVTVVGGKTPAGVEPAAGWSGVGQG